MNMALSLREALTSLTSNKMRSGLTILGIVIGVAAVVAMLAIGRGTQASVTNSIQGIGTNLLFISSGVAPGTNANSVRNPQPLTLADANALALAGAAPDVAAVAPSMQGRFTITASGQTESTTVQGVTAAFASVRNYEVTEGEFISDLQTQARSAVAVIGPDTAQTLFNRTTDVVGQTIKIAGQPFRVTGVLKSKGGSSFGSQDDTVMIPITTAQSRLMHRRIPNSVDTINASATSADTVTAAVDEISQILRLRHRTKIDLDDFTIRTQADILSTAQSITGVLTIFLGGIAGISLLVGGIGIMNIMLVSVTERTKEIGLRKAVGARKRDILLQFLTESVLLGLIGGVVGVLLAWGIASLVQAISAASSTPLTPQITVDSILLATLFSMAVGLLFGIYPANRAASLQPVEALRFE